MKKLFVFMVALSLLLLPFEAYAQFDQKSANPPISQSLVSEGDLALKLVTALKMGTPGDEAQAEDMLSSAGIAPKNGWIADYPVTPIIVGELQSALAAAADAQRLPMGKEEALKAFQDVTVEFGLAVVPGGPGPYAENQSQPDTTIINNYYNQEGPPVVTYYPPPRDYNYLYDWVSYPFWCSGFFFPGFFVLTDFSFVIHGHHHHHHLITNHFFDPKTRTIRTVDPAMRTMGRAIDASLPRTQGFRSSDSRRAATSIFNRSFNGTGISRGPEGTVSRGTTGRTMNGGSNIGRQNEMNLRRGQSGIFNAPNITRGRSFNPPSAVGRSFGSSQNSGRALSSGSRSFSTPRSSSGGFERGGFSGGGHIAAFSGAGHSSGGFSGGGHSSGRHR